MAARLPLSVGLDALLWQALENAPEALSNLRAQTGLPGLSAKAIVEHLGVDRELAWEAVAGDPFPRDRFQRGFGPGCRASRAVLAST